MTRDRLRMAVAECGFRVPADWSGDVLTAEHDDVRGLVVIAAHRRGRWAVQLRLLGSRTLSDAAPQGAGELIGWLNDAAGYAPRPW